MPIDMSAAVAPPRKATASRSAAKASPVTVKAETKSQTEKRAEGINGLAQLGQAGLVFFGQWADAATIGEHAPNISKELAVLADSYDVLAKPIDFLIEVGPFAGLLAAVMPMTLQLLANHRKLNATVLAAQGVVPPELLEAQFKAQMMRKQAAMMKAQQEAMRQAQQAQEELQEFMAQAA